MLWFSAEQEPNFGTFHLYFMGANGYGKVLMHFQRAQEVRGWLIHT